MASGHQVHSSPNTCSFLSDSSIFEQDLRGRLEDASAARAATHMASLSTRCPTTFTIRIARVAAVSPYMATTALRSKRPHPDTADPIARPDQSRRDLRHAQDLSLVIIKVVCYEQFCSRGSVCISSASLSSPSFADFERFCEKLAQRQSPWELTSFPQIPTHSECRQVD